MRNTIKKPFLLLMTIILLSQINYVAADNEYYGVKAGESYTFEDVKVEYKNDTVDGSISVTFTINLVEVVSGPTSYINYTIDWSDETEQITPGEMVDNFGYNNEFWEQSDGQVFVDDLNPDSVNYWNFDIDFLGMVQINLFIGNMSRTTTDVKYETNSKTYDIDGSETDYSRSYEYDEKGVLISYSSVTKFKNSTDDTQDSVFKLTYGSGIPSYPTVFIGGFSIIAVVATIAKIKHRK